MESRGRAVPGGTATSPESAMASELFDHFVSAGTFKSVLSTYRQICEVLRLKPTNVINFYPRLKAKLHSWRAASLWAKLDKRASHKCYNRGKACPNTRVLIIGAGPCGLRAAIEAQLLGAKVVVVEKRDRFSRNNVLHLWPFVIHDLRNLGAKKFFGKFCAGSIDHISIRQLQIILLKVALLLGVEVHENVGFECLIEPQQDQTYERIGWHARISPLDHPVSQYEFDVLMGADGKRNTLLGFNRKEFRGKLAIAVTANFINRHTIEEARVPEISGVAFIFNQKFFQDMREQTAIDLENIVYYKDDTHYFVMTAKKQSLLERGVIIRDYNDTARLLAPENVDREALMEYARDAADFATNYQLPSLDFAVNHYGQADVAMFDFTSMYAAENACRVIEKKGYKLLQGLVGDSLLEPFWPTGSGCARGFLSSFDAAWMIRSWASGRLSTLQVLAEREAIYRLLAQTTPENLSKDLNQYTLNPSSRYPNLNLQAVLPSQVRSLYDTDGKMEENILDVAVEAPKKKKRRESMIHPDTLLHWCQKQVALQDKIKIQDFTSSWKSGLSLCAILHRYRPDLIDLAALDPENIAKNNQLAFDICERELGIPPIMTGQEMAECAVPDKLTMVSYISQVYESFRGEIPVVCYPNSHSGEERTSSPNRQLHSTPLSILNRIGTKLQSKRKYSIEKESKERERGENVKRRSTSLLTHKRRSKERGLPLDKSNQDVILTDYKSLPTNKPRESINTRVKHLEEKMMRDAGLRCHLSEETESSKAARIRSEQTELNIKLLQEQLKKNGSETNFKTKTPKVGKLRKDEWNVKIIEEKTKQQQNSHLKTHSHTEKPKIYRDIFASKLQQMDEKIKAGGTLTPEEEARYKRFDASLNKLKNKLSKGNLEAGEKGQNQTAAMAEHMSSIWNKKAGGKKDPLPPAPVVNVTVETDSSTNTSGSETCYFCKKRVYLMERLSAEGLFFHRSCFKCEYCSASLRLGNYSFDRDAICGGKFYCAPHFRMQKPDHRWQEMMKRKQAFLSCALEEQEKEKLYKTLLDNTEKALSPGKQADKVDTPAKDSTSEEVKQEDKEVTPSNLLTKPSSPFGRDQTPERVEYENSIIELSEEELLTSELEEEELTQKNLGPSQDLATSEDEYSDLSTDTESDEEAFAEELERSLTADETRKLAETWNRKYSAEHSLIQNVSSSSAADDEGSDTEIGSDDTSDDIDSDAEYSLENSEEDGASSNKDAEPENQDANKTPDAKEFTMEVPVIDLKSINKLSEDETSSESDISEELADSEDDSEGETGTEVDSESEAKEPVPPPQIPTIIIHESPPQDTDLDQEWNANVSASKTDNIENSLVDESVIILSDTSEVNDYEEKIENPVDKLATDLEQPAATTSAEHDIDHCGKTMDGKFTSFRDKDKSIDNVSFMKEIKISPMVNESFDNKVNSIAPLATEESSSDLSLSSGINSLAKEIVSDVLKAAKDSIFEYQSNTVDSRTEGETGKMSSSSHSSQYSEKSSSSESANWVVLSSSSEEAKIQLIDLCSPDQPNVHKFSSSISKLQDKDNVEIVDLCSPSSLDSKNATQEMNESSEASKIDSNIILQKESSSSYPLSKDKNLPSAELPSYDSCLDSEHLHHALHTNAKDSITPDKPVEIEADTEDIILEDTMDYDKVSMSDEFLNNSGDLNFISPFVTQRKKDSNKSRSDVFNWDSDNSISLPWCAEDISNEEIIDLSKDGIYHANVAQAVDAELAKEKQITKSEKDTTTTIFDKGSLNFEFSDEANITNSVLSKSLPTPSVSMPHEISESLLHTSVSDSDKLASSVPKNIMPCELSINSSVESKESTPSLQLTADLVNMEKNLSSETIDSTTLNNLSNSDVVSSAGMKQEICSKSDSKYKGYSGSFAEKVRPKSLFCDSIYLRSLDIKLQKQPFSSLNKSDDKLDECSQVSFSSGLRRKLFVESDDSMNENSKECLASTIIENNQCSPAISSSAIQKSACIKSSNVPDETTDKLISTSLSKAKAPSHKHTSVSFSAPESYSDLVSPYTCVQTKTSEEGSFPTKMRPKCDIDINKLRQKREKRKSVHEDIQGLPFADEEKLVSPIEPPGSSDVFTTPKSTLEKDSKEIFHSSCLDSSGSSTYKTPNLIDEERYTRLQSTVDQEKARLEARARARLKSDEELGLSPNNYRKKYKRQLSLNSINYDELCSDEFCDQDDELEDDIISNFCQTKSSGIEETFSMFKNTDLYSKGKTPETPLTSSHHFEPQQEENLHEPDLPPLHIAKGESISVGSLDDNEHENETYINKSMPLLQTSKHSSKTSSSETSPDIFCSETPPFDSKFSSKVRSKGGKTESSGEDDKSKSNGKKSIFSILNFGKGNVSKEKIKQKVKDSEKDLLSSLPNDFGSKVLPKSKPFSHLKLNKSKEKSNKLKAKSVPPEDNATPPSENMLTQEDSVHVSFNSSQAKIIPKYTVYRNPETMISTFPVHLPVPKMENGLAPKASEDSFSDEDDTQGSKVGRIPNAEKCDKNANEKEKKAQRIVQKVQKQQVLKRLRNAQEIQRRLEELEIQQKELEHQGVELEKLLRGERHGVGASKGEAELMQEWYTLVHSKNKLMREEQELTIRLKDLELEDRHSKLQQDMRQRMSRSDSLKTAAQIMEERKILAEMLEIVEKRDELVAMLEQLRLREVEEERNICSDAITKGLKSPLSPEEKS